MAKKCCINHPSTRVWSGDLCINCHRMLYAKPLKKTPLKPISTRQKNILLVYRMKRRRYLKEHPVCEINLRGCSLVAHEIHHTAKKYSEDLWLDTRNFKACCRSCHQKVENSPTLAKQLGIYNYNVSNDKKNDTDFLLLNDELNLGVEADGDDERDAVY